MTEGGKPGLLIDQGDKKYVQWSPRLAAVANFRGWR
jgi:hypothetical protein